MLPENEFERSTPPSVVACTVRRPLELLGLGVEYTKPYTRVYESGQIFFGPLQKKKKGPGRCRTLLMQVFLWMAGARVCR
jgi:hypothetical protein